MAGEAQGHEQVGVHRGKPEPGQVILGEVVNVRGYQETRARGIGVGEHLAVGDRCRPEALRADAAGPSTRSSRFLRPETGSADPRT